MAGEDGGGLHAGSLEHVGKPHASPFGRAGAAIGPLVAARLRGKEGAAIAAAFEHQAAGDRPELRLELGEREFELLVDLAVDHDLPGLGRARRFRNLPVVADEELVGRGGIVVEQLLRRLRHQRALTEHDQLVALAREIEILRPLGRGRFGCGSLTGLHLSPAFGWETRTRHS